MILRPSESNLNRNWYFGRGRACEANQMIVPNRPWYLIADNQDEENLKLFMK